MKKLAGLIEKIPAKKRWELTTKILTRILAGRGTKHIAPLLGKGDGIAAPVWGWEWWEDIAKRVWGEGGKRFYPWLKQKFNIPVEDALGAVNLVIIAAKLLGGPEWEAEIIEATPEKAVIRHTKCTWWEIYQEYNLDPDLCVCPAGHQARVGKGIKAVNPKIKFKLLKAMPRGDPYCEGIYEFKED